MAHRRHCALWQRYVDFSIRYLAQEFDALGVERREIEVKLFGGADVLSVSCVGTGRLTIGALNCECALEVLRAEGLSRRIRFHTGTGELLLRRLANSSSVRFHHLGIFSVTVPHALGIPR